MAIVHDSVNPITQDDATEILKRDMHVLLEAGGFNKNTVSAYAEAMRQYKFPPVSCLHFLTSKRTSEIYLCNGRHRVHAVIQSQRTQRFYCWIHKAPDVNIFDPPHKINREEILKYTQREYDYILAMYGYRHPFFGPEGGLRIAVDELNWAAVAATQLGCMTDGDCKEIDGISKKLNKLRKRR